MCSDGWDEEIFSVVVGRGSRVYSPHPMSKEKGVLKWRNIVFKYGQTIEMKKYSESQSTRVSMSTGTPLCTLDFRGWRGSQSNILLKCAQTMVKWMRWRNIQNLRVKTPLSTASNCAASIFFWKEMIQTMRHAAQTKISFQKTKSQLNYLLSYSGTVRYIWEASSIHPAQEREGSMDGNRYGIIEFNCTQFIQLIVSLRPALVARVFRALRTFLRISQA